MRGRLAGKAIAMQSYLRELGKILAAFLCSSSTMIAATAMENFTLHSDVEAREEIWLFLHRSQILPPAEGKVSQRRELCQNLRSSKPQLPWEMVLSLVVVS